MKHLFVYVADADALAFMREILNRPEALGVGQFTYDIERHTLRDAGMVQSGAELVRMKKGRYSKALLMWDHHGSGRDHKQSPEAVQAEIQEKLDSFTWKDNSAAIALVPELEQWLWFCGNALASHCGIAQNILEEWVREYAEKLNNSPDVLKGKCPKELFEYVMRERLKKTISPRDFAEIGRRASIKNLQKCQSFQFVLETLRGWLG